MEVILYINRNQQRICLIIKYKNFSNEKQWNNTCDLCSILFSTFFSFPFNLTYNSEYVNFFECSKCVEVCNVMCFFIMNFFSWFQYKIHNCNSIQMENNFWSLKMSDCECVTWFFFDISTKNIENVFFR